MNGGSAKHELEFMGLDGSNPLAFLAALGTLRSLSLAWPEAELAMRWQKSYAWAPVLCAGLPVTEESVLKTIFQQLGRARKRTEFKKLGKNLKVKPERFKEFARNAASSSSPDDRVWADFAAAFGCEATTRNGFVQATALQLATGQGHQHFLAIMSRIAEKTEEVHLRKALFQPWKYDDPLENLTLRWDPLDDIRYALRGRNPSGDPARKQRGSVLGANRLAIEGLPLFPTAPRGGQLHTTGFSSPKNKSTFWTWPIWDCPIPVEVIRTVLAHSELQNETPSREALACLGVVEIYRSEKVKVDKYRNFTPSRSVDHSPL
jgi:hypothetical protein